MLVKQRNHFSQRSRALWRTHRSAVLIMGLFILLGTALLVRSMAATEPPIETDSGEFIHGVSDDFRSGHEEDSYALKQADGQYVDVTLDPAKVPKKPKTGSKVHIRGRRHGNDLDVANEAGAGLIVDAPPSSSTTTVGPAQLAQPDPGAGSTPGAAATPLAYTRGILMVNLKLGSAGTNIAVQTPVRSESIEKGYLATTLTPDRFWAETSYGQLSLTSTVIGTVTITIPNTDCSLASIHNWADLADNAAVAAGMNLLPYTNMAYVVPMDPNASGSTTCIWGGYADIGGSRTWLSQGYASFNASGNFTRYIMGTEAHEFGHNLGLLHSASMSCTLNGLPAILSRNCSSDIYGDIWDVMGSQDGYHLLDNYHREQLGFLPAAKIQTVAASGTYTLASSDVNPASTTLPQSIRIARTGASPAQYLEIETRSVGSSVFDNFAATDKVVNGFLVRIVPVVRTTDVDYSYVLDAEPTTPDISDAAFTTETFSDPATNTQIRLVSHSAGQVVLSVTLNGVAPGPAPSPSPTPPPSPVPGDANGDGLVNIFDYSVLSTHDGQNYSPADFNHDGTVGAADLSILLAHWTG